MVAWLRRHKFLVYPLSLCDLSKTHSSVSYLKHDHIVLVSLLVCKNECSWFIIYKGVAYHNFDEIAMDEIFFLNKPVRSAYLISYHKWINTSLFLG